MQQLLYAVLTMVAGVIGCAIYFIGSNFILDMIFPAKGSDTAKAARNMRRAAQIRPWLFLGPALIALILYLVYPVFEGPDAGVWEWDGRVWKRVSAEGPSPRHVHALQYDPRRRQVVLVGGQTVERPSRFLGDAWTWDGVRWTSLTTTGEAPSARAGGALLEDSRNERLIYFGGYAGPPMRFATDLWFLTSSRWIR